MIERARPACGGVETAEPPATGTAPPAETTEPARGGTLKVGLVFWAQQEASYTSPDGKALYALDPQADFNLSSLELFRCFSTFRLAVTSVPFGTASGAVIETARSGAV